MGQPRVLTESISRTLEPAGFKMKSDSWYQSHTETVLVLNLQKSSHSRQYYMNIAIWLKAFGQEETPRENKCHIRFRIEELCPDEEEHVGRILNLEDASISEAERALEIKSLVADHALNFFSRVSTLEGIRQVIRTDPWLKDFVLAKGRAILDVNGR